MKSVYPLKYVVKRNNVFYYRRRIPPILQSYFGKPVFMVSLRTSDLSSAKQASFRYDQKIQHLLALTVMNSMAKIPTSNPYSLQLIIRFSTYADGRVEKTTELTSDDLRIFHEMGMDTDKVSEFVTKLHMNSKTADESIIPNIFENRINQRRLNTWMSCYLKYQNRQ